MSTLLSQKNRNIGIFGLGRTGMAAYEAVKDVASSVICYDELEASREAFRLKFGNNLLADITDPKWQSLDKIILSPGIPLTHKIVALAKQHNIPITSDIDLLFEECPRASFIGITGTNGKSTTTALTRHILQAIGFNYAVGGNIGIPVLSMPFNHEGYILELSSFQLDMLESFKAKVAVLLNITPDHLDRHFTMDLYAEAKKKIFDRMDKDSFSVVNIDNDLSRSIFSELAKEERVNLISISTQKKVDKGVAILDDKIFDNIFEEIVIDLPFNKYLQGAHNKENMAASYAICRILSQIQLNKQAPTPLALDYSKQIVAAISTFKGLSHRMQYVGNIKDISFYNDSKATNSEAASKSLSALDNIYWLAGGIAKEGGIEGLKPWFKRITKACLFGKDREMLAKTLEGEVDYQLFENLDQAFACAFEDAKKDSRNSKNIVLAPACASLDQFKSFEQRGDSFIKLCHEKIERYEGI